MDFVQKAKFLLLLLFTESMSENIGFLHLWKKTIIFRAKNWSFKKGPKKRHFLKGLVHEFFLMGVFHRTYIRKHRFWYCLKKRMILRGGNWSFKKGQKMDIFERGESMDIVKKAKFLLSLFFTEIMPENIVIRYLWKNTIILRPKKLKF